MDGNTRRLPPWMIAGASSGVTTTTSNRTDEGEIKQEADAPKTKKKRKTRRDRDDSDREEPKKVEIRRGRGVRRKIKEEEAKPNIDGGKGPEIFHSVTCPEDEDLTVDDLLSFAQEYVKGDEEDQAKEIRLVDVNDESDMGSSKGETNGTRDTTSEDMLNLLLGPFFKKSGTT